MRSPRAATKSGPRSLQLEKAHTQQQRPNAAKNKLIKKKKGAWQNAKLLKGLTLMVAFFKKKTSLCKLLYTEWVNKKVQTYYIAQGTLHNTL